MQTRMIGMLHKEGVVVLGGWQVSVPEIRIDSETRSQVQAMGINRMRFDTSIQLWFERGMLMSIKSFMKYWVIKYQQMFPDLQNDDGTMAGFDPEDLMRYWLPSERVNGARAQDTRARLVEYGQAERRRNEQ